MKKLYYLLLLTLCATVMFCNISCSNNDEPINKVIPTPQEATIVGEWEFGNIIVPCNKKNSIEFTENYGFIEYHLNSICDVEEYEDNYTLVGNQLTYFGTTKTIIELSTTRLVLSYPNNDVEIFYRKH